MIEETKICPYCGKELLADAEICWNCNNSLMNNETKNATQNSQDPNDTCKLTIKIPKVPMIIVPSINIRLDGKEYNLKNGESLEIDVIRGRHRIICKAITPIFKKENELVVNVENDTVIGIKYDRISGKLKIQEGEFKNDNLLCIIGFFIALSYFFTILLPILGIIIAIIGLYQVSKTKEHGKGLAIIGIILGIVAIITEILFLFYF